MTRVTDSHHMVLVGCNSDAGTFEGKAFGLEDYAPGNHAESLFTASILIDDDPASFWETKNGIAFQFWHVDEEQIARTKRLHYRAIHGAQHVGNIFWNAYFVTEDVARQMVLDLEAYSQFYTEGEWSDTVDEIRRAMAERMKMIEDAKQQPKLPGLKRMPVGAR